ncbi:MAG: SusC/RagA family TonB-linked outer membrane protein, partial [Chitinophagaceae bacterium]
DVTESLGASNTVSISLKTEDKSLGEVVVVGYGSVKKKDFTGSIASIKGESLRDIPVQSFDQALSGKAVGVNVSLPNAVLNNPPVIRIRGINSLTGSSQPLIIIDGVPALQGDASTNLSANNALATINPGDIDDIQILKDASATAIYGSRATNGVMLITTKKGKNGKAKVSYDFSYGWTKPFNVFEVLNADQYIATKNEALVNLNQANVNSSGQPAGAPLFFAGTMNGRPIDTRWADHIYQTGKQQNHNISVSGGNENTKYFFSTNYNKQDGILQTNTFERMQMRMNIDNKVNDYLKIGGNLNFSRSTTFSPSTGSLPGGAFGTAGSARLAFVTAPNVSPYAADGRYNIIGIDDPAQRNSFNQIGRNNNLTNSGFVNPVMIRDLNIISSELDQLVANVNLELKLTKGLYYRSTYGANYQTVEDKTFYNALHGDGIQTTATTDDGLAFNVVGKQNFSNFQNTLTYDFSLGQNKHNFTVLAGHEENKFTINRWGGSRQSLADNFFNEYQGGFTTNNNPVGNFISENYILSFFGRINYNYKNKYYFTSNIRRDGYSAYSDGKKWGTFYGASVAYAISEENFWKNSRLGKTFENVKLRGSWGKVGSVSAITNFASLSTFSPAQYGLGNASLFFSQAGNNNIQWENSEKLDIGLNFSVFKGRVNVEFGYYNTKLTDLIIPIPLPTSMGVPNSSIEGNAAVMVNRGIEFSINARIIDKKDFRWNVGFNFATQYNVVNELAPGVPDLVGITGLERTNITRVGNPVGALFLVKSNGVDPTTGRRILVNAAGREVLFDFSNPVAANRWTFRDNGLVAPAIDLARDGIIAGNATPTLFGGFQSNINWKQFDFGIDMYFSFGNQVYFG